jgi:hypothetical protein
MARRLPNASNARLWTVSAEHLINGKTSEKTLQKDVHFDKEVLSRLSIANLQGVLVEHENSSDRNKQPSDHSQHISSRPVEPAWWPAHTLHEDQLRTHFVLDGNVRGVRGASMSATSIFELNTE